MKEFNFEKTPVVDIVNEMILDAAKRNASDIHFDPTANVLKVRVRIDGELLDYVTVPESIKNPLITRIKIISGMNITESRLPQDGAIKSIGSTNLDLRVSTLPTVYGEKVVIRILDYTMSANGLESLGFSSANFEKIQKLINTPSGIILITGATGTGKSTTLYTMLQALNTESRNIITVEDPVEMKLEGINQVQAMTEIGLTFASALRSILRQDPNIIMIGEIRDGETARIAVRASITGHLVLSTIHTNNSLNTIERLVDMDVERYLLGSALSGVISQRLVKKLCPRCRSSRKATEYEKNVYKKALNIDITDIYTPVGCDECTGGYKGRIAIQEVLLIDQEIRDAITNGTKKESLRTLVYSGDTITLLEDGLTKVMEGLTSFEEVLRVIDIEDDLGEKDRDIKNALIGKISLAEEANMEVVEGYVNKEPNLDSIEENNIKSDNNTNKTKEEAKNLELEEEINEAEQTTNSEVNEESTSKGEETEKIEPEEVLETSQNEELNASLDSIEENSIKSLELDTLNGIDALDENTDEINDATIDTIDELNIEEEIDRLDTTTTIDVIKDAI